jgi:hypothetical protein
MFGQMMVEGAARAARLVPLLFMLNAASPAAAQLPRPAAPAQPFESAVDEAPPLTLTEHHVDVRIHEGRAQVRSLLTYRNDRAQTVSTGFAFPFPALLGQDESRRALGDEATDAGGDCGDVSPEDAEYLEAGEPIPPRTDAGYVTVAPGEEIRVETFRTLDLARHAGGYRLALPLPADRDAPFSPQFTADVRVDDSRAVTRLVSATHGGAASGLGSPQAQLTVPGGRAYTGAQFVVDVDFGPAATAFATWGREACSR